MKKAPHLASYLEYTTRPATSADYYIPKKLTTSCKIIDIKISKHLCTKLSCNRTRERDLCMPHHIASYYRVGDDSWDVQCQPACYNISNKVTYEKDGTRNTDAPWLNYAFGECRLVPHVTTTFLEKPFYRSDVKYEKRKNDMPTGFSRTLGSNPYGCGFSYRNNETYCNYYDMTLKLEPGKINGPCSYTTMEKVLNPIVGMNLINTIKSSVRTQMNITKTPFDEPDGLIKLPDKMDPIFTTDGWRADINHDFKVPELMKIFDSGEELRDILRKQHQRRRRETVETTDTEESDKHNEENTNTKTVTEHIQHSMEAIIDMLKHDDFWESIGVLWAFDKSVKYIRKYCLKIVGTLQILMTKDMVHLMKLSFSKSVLRGTVRSVATSIIVTSAVRMAGKTSLMIAKATVQITSVVGWILAAATILDIVFSIWDPYGYKNISPEEFPAEFMQRGEMVHRKKFRVTESNFKFLDLVNTILDENELMELQVLGLVERAIYLDTLDVNSDGQLIDRSDIIYINDENDVKLQESMNDSYIKALVKCSTFDSKEYENYNKRFLRRIDINGTFNNILMCSVIGMFSCIFIGIHMLTCICSIIVVVTLTLSRHAAVDDTLIILNGLMVPQPFKY